jgi:hypothetical protein
VLSWRLPAGCTIGVLHAGATGLGIPTARDVAHVGFTVPNLNEGVDFFAGVLGCDLLYRTGAFFDPTGAWMSRHYGAPRQAGDGRASGGLVTNVELLAWDSPE